MTKRKERADKIKLTAKDLKQIETMAGLGFNQEQISSVLGFSVDTLKRRLKEDEDKLSALMGRGKTKALSKIAQKAYTLAINGNTSMIKYFLNCQGGWDEKGQIIEVDQKEEDDTPNYTVDEITNALTDEEFDIFIEHYRSVLNYKKLAVERIEKGLNRSNLTKH